MIQPAAPTSATSLALGIGNSGGAPAGAPGNGSFLAILGDAGSGDPVQPGAASTAPTLPINSLAILADGNTGNAGGNILPVVAGEAADPATTLQTTLADTLPNPADTSLTLARIAVAKAADLATPATQAEGEPSTRSATGIAVANPATAAVPGTPRTVAPRTLRDTAAKAPTGKDDAEGETESDAAADQGLAPSFAAASIAVAAPQVADLTLAAIAAGAEPIRVPGATPATSPLSGNGSQTVQFAAIATPPSAVAATGYAPVAPASQPAIPAAVEAAIAAFAAAQDKSAGSQPQAAVAAPAVAETAVANLAAIAAPEQDVARTAPDPAVRANGVTAAISAAATAVRLAPAEVVAAAMPATTDRLAARFQSSSAAPSAEAASSPVAQPVQQAAVASGSTTPVQAAGEERTSATGVEPVEPARTPSTQSTVAATPQLATVVDTGSLQAGTAASATQPALAQPVEGPQDFGTLVARLNEAREAADPQVVRTAINHADFGRVSLQFRHDDNGLAVTMANADPGFSGAVQAAASASLASNAGSGGDEAGKQQPQQQYNPASAQQAQTSGNAAGGNGQNQQARADQAGQSTNRAGGSASSSQEQDPTTSDQLRDGTRNDGGIYA